MQANRKKRPPRRMIVLAMAAAGIFVVMGAAGTAQASSGHGYRSHHGSSPSVGGSISIRKDDFAIRVSVGNRDRGYHRGPRHHGGGYYVTQMQTVMVSPGYQERVWVPPVYQTCYDAWGRPYQSIVRQGHYRVVNHPPVYEQRPVQVWVPHRR